MHPRWPHSTAAARPPMPGRPPLRPPPALPQPPAPRPSGPGRRWSSGGQIVLLAAAAALVAGCGHSGTPATTKAASHPATPCGSAKTPANVPVKIEVAKGKVTCADALTIEHAYTSAVAQGRAPGNGRGPVQVSGWKCQAFTTPVSLKTGDVSACYRNGAEILAVLPPP
jgi:hypothetical protein